jgi:hypothetical protein
LDTAIVARADVRGTPRPLDAYRLADEQARLVSRARIIVGDKCMGPFGFQPVSGWIPEGAQDWLTFSRYGLWDSATAAQIGYQSPPLPNQNTTPMRFAGLDAIAVYQGSVTSYHGRAVPPGGCEGAEIQAIAGATPMRDPHFVGELDSEALLRSTQDSRVRPLIAAWVGCMKAKGWPFQTVMAPFDYWSSRRGTDRAHPAVSSEELRSAADDIGCKQSTKLLGTWLAADVAYQKALIERDAGKLAVYKSDVDDILGRANQIIAHG